MRILSKLAVALIASAVTVSLAAPTAQASRPDGNGDPHVNVIGGTPADKGEYPWAVWLDGCGGSLIRPNVVLTAGHCVDSTGPTTDWNAQLGMVDREDPEKIEVASTYQHDGGDIGTDWALIQLAEPVADVPLLTLNEDPALDEGTFTIMGWGTTEQGDLSQVLLEAEVPFVDDETCIASGGSYADLVPEGEICAGFAEGGIDTCQGDSGGPMVIKNEADEWVQIGIVSWGEGCAEPNKPGVYAQVSNFAAEINAKADELAGGETPERR
ncbi:S1 family peptidase [Nocardioides speluncae]|uniref:S1 family peptidase n=1 Tax=Nocardioides speluncae TaxID=2670337 RepID=UPI000D695A09|nr:serine protease [Nocardioides speluncae]